MTPSDATYHRVVRQGVRAAAAACLAAAVLAGCGVSSKAGSTGSGSGADGTVPSSSSVGIPATTAGSDGAAGRAGSPGSPGSPVSPESPVSTDANGAARWPDSTGSLAASDANGEEVAAVTDLANRRLAALTAKDRAAWMSTVDDPADPFGRDQGDTFDRMSQLPLSSLTMGGVSVGPGAVGGAEGSVARFHIGYRFTGYDRGERTFELAFAVVKGPQGWRFTGVAADQPAAQPWDLPGMTVAASATSLVVGDQPVPVLQGYLAMADTGRARVAGVWGSAVPAVLVAPRTTDELVRLLGRASAAGLDQVAAVTDGPVAPGAPATGDRVYLNPATFASLTATGRQVIITHELTHVTVRATTTRPVPTWLSEGFADFVGFTGSGLGTATVAADLLDRVRTGAGPTGLPTASDFDPTMGEISPTYNAAWLVVTRMAQTHGPAAVVEFYRAVSGGPEPDPSVRGAPDDLAKAAFSTVLGTTEDAAVADWLAYLRRLAG